MRVVISAKSKVNVTVTPDSPVYFEEKIYKGEKGDTGATGPQGSNGVGVPIGGTAGQILAKIDSTNYNTQWINNFALPALTSGSVLFSNGTTIAQDNSNFFWDNTNKKFLINGTTDSYSDLIVSSKIGIKATVAKSAEIIMWDQNTTNYLSIVKRQSGAVGNMGLPAGCVEIGTTGNTAIGIIARGSYLGFGVDSSTERARFATTTGNLLINNTVDQGGKLQIKAGGAASTDIALRIRNSGDTFNLANFDGSGRVVLNANYTAGGGFGTLIMNTTDTATDNIGPVLTFSGNYTGTTPVNFAMIRGAKSPIGGQRGYLSFHTDGSGASLSVERMRVDWNGNVGIGTTTPATKLDVRGGFNLYSDTSNHYLEATSLSSTDGTLNFRRSGNANGWLRFQLGGLQIASDIGSGECRILASSGGYFPTIYSNGVERLRISTTGLLQLEGTTNLFPAIKRNGAAINFRLADDSGFCNINAQSIIAAGDVAVGTGQAYNFGTNANQINHYSGISFGFKLSNAWVARITTSGTVFGSDTINSSAILQAVSTTKGFLPPTMTNAQRLAIATPAIGLIVYCTDVVEGLYINKSTGWTFVI